jgi:hypothetical protein
VVLGILEMAEEGSDSPIGSEELVSARQGGTIRLYHGTNLGSAKHLGAHGLDEMAARQYNSGGEFWATTDPAIADWFAAANQSSPPAARFEFDLPSAIMSQLMNSFPLKVMEHRAGYIAYEFLPNSFPVVNLSMVNRVVVPLP